MQRPAQLEQEAYVLQRTSQGLDARFKVRQPHNFSFSVFITTIRDNNNHNQHKPTLIMIVFVATVITVVTHHSSNNNHNSSKLNAVRLMLM